MTTARQVHAGEAAVRPLRPDAERITVDGTDLATIDIDAWRARTAAAFQDFARIELSVRESVGVGDLLRTELPPDVRITDAIAAAGAGAVVDRAGGIDGLLGVRYAAGAERSGGEWQLVALARLFTLHAGAYE